MRAATVLLPAPAGPSIATTSGEFCFSLMLLASYALACAAESRPVACRQVFHPVYRLASHPVFRQTCPLVFRQAWRLVSRRPIYCQTCLLVFHPVCHSAGLRTSLSAATVSRAARRGQRVDVLSGHRRRGETKAEAGGWLDSWCAGHRFVHRLVHPAVLVRILGRLVLVPILVWILVWILVQNARVPAVLDQGGKRQVGVRKGAPLVEQSLLDGRTRGRLVSAVPFDRQVGRSAGQSVDWGEAFLESETEAWRRTEPRALAAPLLAFPAAFRRARGHRSSAVHESFLPRLARTPVENCGAKDRRAVLAFPAAAAFATPC
jgi:hypothetical protein